MREQASQIDVAPFADASQVPTPAGRRLTRREAEPLANCGPGARTGASSTPGEASARRRTESRTTRSSPSRARPSSRWPGTESTGADPPRSVGRGSDDSAPPVAGRRARSTPAFLRRTPGVAYPRASVDVRASCGLSFWEREVKGPLPGGDLQATVPTMWETLNGQ